MLTKGVTPEIFFDNPNLRHLYLHDNPWICDCTQLYPGYVYLTSLAAKTEALICHSPRNVTGFSWKLACANEWKREILHKSNNKTWGLILVSLLTVVVLTGTIISIRHSMKLKRQARNQRLEVERAEVRERLRLLQRRYVHLYSIICRYNIVYQLNNVIFVHKEANDYKMNCERSPLSHVSILWS